MDSKPSIGISQLKADKVDDSNSENPAAFHWLSLAREIQALAQTGSHYAANEYDRYRYRRLTEISAEIVSEHSNLEFHSVNNTFHEQYGYATPRVDVQATVFKDGKLLLVREQTDND